MSRYGDSREFNFLAQLLSSSSIAVAECKNSAYETVANNTYGCCLDTLATIFTQFLLVFVFYNDNLHYAR